MQPKVVKYGNQEANAKHDEVENCKYGSSSAVIHVSLQQTKCRHSCVHGDCIHLDVGSSTKAAMQFGR